MFREVHDATSCNVNFNKNVPGGGHPPPRLPNGGTPPLTNPPSAFSPSIVPPSIYFSSLTLNIN